MATANRSIIKDLGPRRYHMDMDLQKVLNANGMHAELAMTTGGDYVLIARAHDSNDAHYYTISKSQFDDMTRGGFDSLREKAYMTFVNVVKDDFYAPRYYAEARSALTPVNMGQWGKQLLPGEEGYGLVRPAFRPFNGPRWGWFDRLTFGMGCFGRYGRSPYSPFLVAERKDGYLRPGEYRTGCTGFYDKGRANSYEQSRGQEALNNIDVEKVERQHLVRPKGQSLPLNPDAKFTDPQKAANDFNELLRSHGIDITTNGEGQRVLRTKSDGVDANLERTMSQEDYNKLMMPFPVGKKDKHGKLTITNGGLDLDERIAIINKYISKDYSTPLTKEMLESRDYVKLKLNPDAARELKLDEDGRFASESFGKNLDVIDIQSRRKNNTEGFVDKWNSIGTVDGHNLGKDYGFYVPKAHGRRLDVGEVQAYRYNNGDKSGFRMTAVIGGKVISKDISKNEYITFLNSDDENRLRLFAKTFDKDVSIKSSSHGKLEDPDISKDIAMASTASSLVGSYSLIGNGYQAYLTDATAWKDEKSGKYSINVRTSKDAGIWSYELTEAQYQAFKRGNDQAKLKVIKNVIPFVETKTDANGKIVKQPLEIVDNGKLSLDFAKSALLNNENITPQEAERHAEAVAIAHKEYILSVLPGIFRKNGDKDLERLVDYVEKNHRLPSELTESEAKKVNAVLDGVRKNGLYNQEVADALNKGGLKPQIVFSGLTEADLVRLGLSKSSAGKLMEMQGKTVKIPDLRQQANAMLKQASVSNVDGWKPLNGEMIKESREWRRSGSNGRSVSVGDISIEKMRDAKTNQEVKGHYRITAIIDGNPISHEIDQKTFNKLGLVNNDQRLKLFDKIFPEIEMRRKPGEGFHLGAAILAAFDAARMVVGTGLMMGRQIPPPRPEIYSSHTIYYRDDVPGMSYGEMAARRFEADMNAAMQEGRDPGLSRGV